MEQILCVKNQEGLEIAVRCNYMIYAEGDIAKGVLVEDLQSDGESIFAISRLWEFANSWDAMGNVHVLPATRYFLSNTVVALPLHLFLEEFNIVHATKLKAIPAEMRQPISTFSHVGDQDGKLRRVAASKVQFASSQGSRALSLGIKLRKAIATKLRKVNATKGKITMCFPFAKDEVWRILQQHCNNVVSQGKSKMLRLQHRSQLDILCGERWDCHIFGSSAFNIVTSLHIKTCSTENFTITFRFLKDNRPFDQATYRETNPF